MLEEIFGHQIGYMHAPFCEALEGIRGYGVFLLHLSVLVFLVCYMGLVTYRSSTKAA